MEDDKFKKIIDDIIAEGESEVVEFKENNFKKLKLEKEFQHYLIRLIY